MSLEELTRYDRATVALWERSHAELSRGPGREPMVEVAVHALLSRLRLRAEPSTIVACYEADAGSEFALIGSLLPGGVASELLWRVRDAAFHLRWLELGGS